MSVLVLALAGGERTSAADPPKLAEEGELRGVVLDGQGRGLTWVMISVRDGTRLVVGTALSDEGGRFVVSGLPAGRLSLAATLFGTPNDVPGPDVVREVSAGATDFTLILERGVELLLKSEGRPFVADVRPDNGTKKSPGVLIIESPKGPLTYYAGIDAGRAAFRRIKPGLPWTLWIPWRSTMKGTLYETGTRLEAGERSVALQPGLPVSVRIPSPPPREGRPMSSIAWERVFVSRGRIEIPGEWRDDGEVVFPPLAAGRWTFTARTYEQKTGSLMEATEEAEVGGPPIVLRPALLKK